MSATADPSWNPFRRHVPGPIVKDSAEPRPTLTTTKSKTWKTAVERVESWPEEARPLKEHTWVSYLYGLGDILLAILPFYFILLGIAAAILHNKPTKDNGLGSKVEFAMDLGPTMFPIVFAAIIGRSMKMIARYLAEKGSKLGTLELMVASQSVWGTFESQLLMQRLTLVGANLLFLWALSPLGGQASLRLMRRDQQSSYAPSKLRYLSTGPGGALLSVAASKRLNTHKSAEAGSLYNTALLAPQIIKNGPRDSWGNMKIPRYEALDLSTMDVEGWLDVPSVISVPETYSSLVGLPIAGLPDAANSNFTVEYNYISVTCTPFSQRPYPGTHGTSHSSSTNYTELDSLLQGHFWTHDWGSTPFDPFQGRASFLIDTSRDQARRSIRSISSVQADADTYIGRLDGFVGHYNQSRLNETETNTPRELIFASVYGVSRDAGKHGLNIARCSLLQHHVEALVLCIGSQCSTRRLRKSLSDNRPNALTAFEFFNVMDSMAREFPTAIKFNEGSSPTEQFMANTSTSPFVQTIGQLDNIEIYTDLSKVPSDTFSRRFSLVLNTYYQLSTQPSGYFGGLSSNLSAYGPDTLPVTDIDAYLPANLSATQHTFFDWYNKYGGVVMGLNSPFIGATATSEVTTTTEIFVCNFAWLALLLTSSTVILIIGGVAIILKRMTLGPEMFGYVSSMVYHNPWIKIPQGGTMLDAMERTRLLKDVEVHIADVCGDDKVGHIALAAGVPLRHLERGRLYC